MRITHTQYTSQETGKLMHQAMVNWQPATAATEDEQHVAQYARELFHTKRAALKEPVIFTHWNGDTRTETLYEHENCVQLCWLIVQTWDETTHRFSPPSRIRVFPDSLSAQAECDALNKDKPPQTFYDVEVQVLSTHRSN